MIKPIFASLLLLVSELALAGSPCDIIPGKQSHAPLKINDGLVCIVEQPVLDEQNRQHGIETVIYTIMKNQELIKADGGELSNDGGNSPGTIVDVFTLNIDRDKKNQVIVIQFVEVSKGLMEPNSSGKFYSIYVFNQTDKGLRLNKRATEWFGSAYSWFTNGKTRIYEFPYLTQKSVKNSLFSPFISLMYRDGVIPVVVKQKSYLYEDSMVYGKPTKYLIAGDKATVDKYTAGWCQVNYTGGKKPLQMWMMCDALEVDSGKR